MKVFLLFFLIEHSFCGDQYSCKGITNMSNTDCFNDKIIFKNKFRAGHFVVTKEGTLIIEYSSDETNYRRFFYGLKKNGRYYFENESPFRHFNASNPENNDLHGRYESKNFIVHMKNDTNKEKEYIFSTSIWTTVTELHDLETGISKYWNTKTFWDIIEIFSYEINIFELKENDEMHYVCAFTQHESYKIVISNEEIDFSMTYSLRKFAFDDFNTYKIIAKEDNTDNYNSRMISCFIIPEWHDIVVFYLKAADNNYKDAYYAIDFYHYNLVKKNTVQKDKVEEPNSGVGIFFRAFHLKERWAAFIYFKDKWGINLKFEIAELNGGETNRRFDIRSEKTFNNFGFAPHVNFNDFFKVDENRLVFVTTEYPYGVLNFLIFDLYNNYYNFKIRRYRYDISHELYKEIQGYTYNGYIIFTYCSNSYDIFSTLLFFGYANGTDFTIDISPYLMDTGDYNSINNLYSRLYQTFEIDNNIFGYEKIPKINLVQIPNELIFYNGSGSQREINK